jgi:hypothetical protein
MNVPIKSEAFAGALEAFILHETEAGRMKFE